MAPKKTGLRKSKPRSRQFLPQPVAELPSGYAQLLDDIKTRIRTAQLKAALSANRELIELYWQIGKCIVERQRAEGWGSSAVERLARDLQAEFPGIAGFSSRNIWRMRTFYLAWTEEVRTLSRPVRESETQFLPQPVAELAGEVLPQAVAEIPWGHNVCLLEAVKDPLERLWYARKTIENGWSRNILVIQIERDLYHRQGRAQTNFDRTLPAPQSDLAREVLKNPYTFDFLTLRGEAIERDLERGLLEHLRQFLLELGVGFAFVGSQFPLEVEGEQYYIDLLFYHLKLRSYVVIDLKMEAFKPEFVGKMNFYLAALDDLLRHSDDQPSVGIILCKSQKKLIVEYALHHMSRPIGVARWQATRALPKNLRNALPSPNQLVQELTRSRAKPSAKKPRRGGTGKPG